MKNSTLTFTEGNKKEIEKYQKVAERELSEFGFKEIAVQTHRFDETVIEELKNAFEYLAEALGVKNRDIGLDGTLSLRLTESADIANQTGKSSVLGGFSSDYTLSVGDGLERLYHEWGHALDSFIRNEEKGLEEGKVNMERRHIGLSPFGTMVRANKSWDINFPDDYVRRSSKADGIDFNRQTGEMKKKFFKSTYYADKGEMFARAFERYFSEKVSEAHSDFHKDTFVDMYEPKADEAAQVIKEIIPSIERLKENHVFHDRNIEPAKESSDTEIKRDSGAKIADRIHEADTIQAEHPVYDKTETEKDIER